jgi:hypothetical protein
MSKEKTVIENSKFKVQIRVSTDGTSTVIRRDLPFIIDKTDKSVAWLVAQGFKESEIEIIGEKPANWDAIFNPKVE